MDFWGVKQIIVVILRSLMTLILFYFYMLIICWLWRLTYMILTNRKKKVIRGVCMEGLGVAKQILGMRITRDNEILKLSHEEYVKKVLNIFNMVEIKPMSIPLASHFWLSKDQSPSTKQKQVYMAKVSYASIIGSLMYVMVCTRSNITHAVGVVSRYISNMGTQH